MTPRQWAPVRRPVDGGSVSRIACRSAEQGQADCAEFVADRKVDVERFFTNRWRRDQAEEAYKLFDTQTTGKTVILPA